MSNQITYLSRSSLNTVKFYLSQSQVVPSAKGLFTSNDIRKGTVLFIDYVKLVKHRTNSFEMDYRQSEQSKMLASIPEANTFSRLNGDKIERIALKDIKEGEELTGNDLQLREVINSLGY